MATSEEAEGISGKFYGNQKEIHVKDKFISESDQKILWDYCEEQAKQYLQGGLI